MTVALITGSSQGIGLAIAKVLLDFQDTVVLAARSEEKLKTAAAQLERDTKHIVTLPTDMADPDQIDRLVQFIRDRFGRLDILVHAAGRYDSGPWAEIDEHDLMAVNYHGPVRLTTRLLPFLAPNEGQIVFINSTQGLQAGRNTGAYAASKFALRAFADSLRAELNPSGIRVLTVFAGSTATPMQASLHEKAGRAYRPEEFLQPADVAAMVAAALRLPRTAEVTELTIRPLQPPRQPTG